MRKKKELNKRQAELLLQRLADFAPKYGKWLAHLMKSTGVSASRHHLLCRLKHEGSKKMSELGKVMQVSATNITLLVDALEKDGYVQRVSDKNDRRATWIELTSKAETDVIFDSYEALTPILDVLIEKFNEEEIEKFIEFIDRINSSIPK